MRKIWRLYRLWLAVCAGYLFGSILTADIAARLASRGGRGRVDLRTVGSGNPGGANAVSNLGKGWGAGVIAGDIGKGAAAAVAGRMIAGGPGGYLASTAAVIGHAFPAWANFRGGKALGTIAGTTIVVFPPWIAVDLALIAAIYKYAKNIALASYVTSGVFFLGAFAWWKRGLPNLWGPKPGFGLPFYAAVATAVVYFKYLTAPEHMGDIEPAGAGDPPSGGA